LALDSSKRVVVFVGGVGGAKLALGLQKIVPPEYLTIIVNTGDDFWHYGLRVCPDVDTVLYTLSNRVDPINGWGVAGDTTTALDTLRTLGEAPWFRLGDQDIALHLLRTHLLRDGRTLTDVIAHLAQVMNIQPAILPMTDAPVATMVHTVEHGELEFQAYFVKHRWQPTVTALRYAGIEHATLSQPVLRVLQSADVILFGPSNPWLSIAPILAVPGMRDVLTMRNIPRVAVTPIVQGEALKGPAAKLMAELGFPVSAKAVANYYGDLLTGFVYDKRDAGLQFSESHDLRTVAFDTIMKTTADKINLAQKILFWIAEEEVA